MKPGGPNSTQVSLIMTVRSDPDGLRELFEALAEQSEMPDEIVVVDGGSEDGTLDELEKWRDRLPSLRTAVAPGTNIAAGRNIAVRMARHDWMVCTDAGCRPVPGWTGALKRAGEHADLVAGTFVVDGESLFERALACAHYPIVEELHDTGALVRISHRLFGRDFRAAQAGGRSMAFSRSAWEAAGGFPEFVYAGEDHAFSAAVVERGFRATLAEEAAVRWRARGTPAENARMFFTYARGDVRTKGRRRHVMRLAAWVGGPLVAVKGPPAGWLAVAAGAASYAWLPLRRARRLGLPVHDWWQVLALIALKDVSQLAGAAVGAVDGIRGVPQPRPDRRPDVAAPSTELSPLASLLRCLECGGELKPSEVDHQPGELRCRVCARAYPVVRGTPRLLRDGPSLDRLEDVKRRTAESFGYEWDRFGALRAEWRKNLLDYLRPHEESSLRGRLLLDIGAGSGRHSYHAKRAGARVVAADLGPSIDVARRNLPPAVLTVQADAEDLPFAPDTFDIVMAIGVLHHLPDPERAFGRIVPLARPGGLVHVYLYWVPPRAGHRRMLRLVELARRVTTRLPHRVLHPLCYPIAACLSAAFVLPYRVLRSHRRLARIADAFPLQAYADYPFRVLVTDQFDRFSAPLERRFTRAEVRDLFESAGLEDVTVLPNNGWVGSGRRPVSE